MSKVSGLSFWCIKRYHTSSNHTINATVWVLRLLCVVQRAHCWRSFRRLRRRDHRRSGCRGSRCGWCTVTRSDSSWCREPQPRCGRRRCMQTGSPRAEQWGYQRQQTRCGSTSTWTQWRWCSWASTPHPDCVYRQAPQWCLQSPPNRESKREVDYDTSLSAHHLYLSPSTGPLWVLSDMQYAHTKVKYKH